MLLWESAGFKLKESQLTADQIQQIFAAVEKGSTDSGSNRTMLGKGKDAAAAVNAAWEDLKSKVQNSAPIKAVDQKFDDAVAKIESGLGGLDNKVNQVIQKYRKFAKERPISQSLIYAALIAAAGISGAGLGGAAVLGLLKMTDKLLQGEKFSSAAYAGGKTGALAYGAGQLGKAMKGGDAAGSAAPKDSETFGLTAKADNSALAKDMADNPMLAQRAGVSNISAATDAVDTVSSLPGLPDQNARAAWAMVQRKIEAGELTDHKALSSELNKALNKTFSDYGVNPNSPDAENSKQIARDVLMKSKDTESLLGALKGGEVSPGGAAPDTLKGAAKMAQLKGESVSTQGYRLSEGQVYLIFNRICAANDHLLAEGILQEGALDKLKGLAAKGLEKAQTVGKNLTTKVTADKLNSAWQKAGAPMDSQLLAAFLGSQGVSPDVVGAVYKSMKIEKPKNAAAKSADQTAKTPSQYADVKAMISKLDKKGRQRMAAYIQKQLGTA
jgi:hypothetical protein